MKRNQETDKLYCPYCGALVCSKPTKTSVEVRFQACLQELTDIAMRSETPSEVLKLVGENFLSLAKSFEQVEKSNEARYQQALTEMVDKMMEGEE